MQSLGCDIQLNVTVSAFFTISFLNLHDISDMNIDTNHYDSGGSITSIAGVTFLLVLIPGQWFVITHHGSLLCKSSFCIFNIFIIK